MEFFKDDIEEDLRKENKENVKKFKTEKKQQKHRHRARHCSQCDFSFCYDVIKCPVCGGEVNKS